MDPNNLLADPHLAYLLPSIVAFFIISSLIFIIPLWMIFKKAGFSPWLTLIFLVPGIGPLIGLILLYIVAFSQWKVVPIAQVAGGTYPPAVYPPPAYPAAQYPQAAPPPVNPSDPTLR